ncbi:hypothetical protein AYI68_g398 [Smittium mucronatum]|uniref:Uncharacterized protein n=1 Tax=Smittium mucronatum TaxID=133383 RepID=A0A1R0H870_9FUNG|nr:hypothetical protein AYI68_g398 [Smittium mucronatum]
MIPVLQTGQARSTFPALLWLVMVDYDYVNMCPSGTVVFTTGLYNVGRGRVSMIPSHRCRVDSVGIFTPSA